MTDDDFWALIEATCSGSADDECAALESGLAGFGEAELVAFEATLQRLTADADRWDLWGAGYLINGGCSDDGFLYFRGWLIAAGRAVYEASLRDPDSLADHPAVRAALDDTGPDLEDEEVLYAAGAAYEATTGQDRDGLYERLPAAVLSRTTAGESWDFEDADENRRRLPRLSALLYGGRPA